MVKNSINGKVTVAIVTNGGELWGAERLQNFLSDAGLRALAVDEDELQIVLPKIRPMLIIANLAGGRSSDIEFCQKLSRLCQAPIIAIGSSTDEDYVVSMIETVVDDYLVRPVNPSEMVARIRSILRRTPVVSGREERTNGRLEAQLPAKSRRGFQKILHNMQQWISKYRDLP
jgi:DNA-binding response OmpR family regulator